MPIRKRLLSLTVRSAVAAVVGCEVAISNINCDALLTLSHKTVKQKRIVNFTAATADLTVKLKSLFLICINKLYNTKINNGESIRVFPISNWTEKDIWQYIQREKIDIVPLYFAAKRPVVYRDGNIIMVDDDRFPLKEGEVPKLKSVRFRTLGCYPLTGGIESTATTLDEIIDETLSSVSSERTSRVIDNEAQGSMERRKREGYF